MVHGELKQIIMSIQTHLKFPKTNVQFMSNTLTFSIEHIKSRHPCVCYFILRCYDSSDEKIYSYTSPRWVINDEYEKKSRTFTISDTVYEEVAYTQLELIFIGVTSENPVWFTELMFYEGEDKPYSIPHMQVKADVQFVKTRYANLYDSNDNYLQVIRPNGEPFRTDCLTKSGCTVIAPYLENETDIDDPVNVFMEFVNQVEQTIDVLR